MILVIGGAYQGKREFVKNVLGIENNRVFYNFHTEIKKCLDLGKNTEELISNIFNCDYQVIVSDEIGCGIVPLESNIRDWREATGRALCKIASECEQVWRVQCGIGSKIKG